MRKEFDLDKRPVVILSTDSGNSFTYKVISINWEASMVDVVNSEGEASQLHFDLIANFGGVYYPEPEPETAEPDDEYKQINLDDIPF